MNAPNDRLGEQERIRRVYQAWLAGGRQEAYAWHRPEIMDQLAAHWRVAGSMLSQTIGTELRKLAVVDVGCGSGGFLRQLVNWGADPRRLTGTEFLQDRLDLAQLRSAPGIRWHLGDLDGLPGASADLVTANTVFSSVLDEAARVVLAANMWRIVAPRGWCMVFDFSYNNPRNSHVRKVSPAELRRYWPAARSRWRSLLLAPPLARSLARMPRIVSELVTAVAPPLRSHFVYMAQKPR